MSMKVRTQGAGERSGTVRPSGPLHGARAFVLSLPKGVQLCAGSQSFLVPKHKDVGWRGRVSVPS